MACLAVSVLILVVATGLPGCAFNHIPDMRAEFDKLPIPPSYQFLGESVGYINPTFFDLDDIVVSHHYRSPLDFEATCDQIKTAFNSPITNRHAEFCQIKAQPVRSGWRAGFVSSYLVAASAHAIPPKAARPRRFTPPRYPEPPDAYTEVNVSIYYYR